MSSTRFTPHSARRRHAGRPSGRHARAIRIAAAVTAAVALCVTLYELRPRSRGTSCPGPARIEAARALQRFISARDPNVPAQAQQIISKANETKELWQDDNHLRAVVNSAMSKASATIEAAGHGRVDGTKLRDDAVAFATANASQPRLALNKYYQVEDELKRRLDDAYRSKNEEDQKYFEPLYEEVVAAGDRSAVRFFTAELIDAISAQDLLSGRQATSWNPKSFAAVAGVLDIDGDAGIAGNAVVVSILDREQVRNFILDLEFSIDAGSVRTCSRLGGEVNPATWCMELQTSGASANVEAGKRTRARCALIGNRFTWRFLDHPLGEVANDIPASCTRKGGIGFQVSSGTKFRLTKCTVKILQ